MSSSLGAAASLTEVPFLPGLPVTLLFTLLNLDLNYFFGVTTYFRPRVPPYFPRPAPYSSFPHHAEQCVLRCGVTSSSPPRGEAALGGGAGRGDRGFVSLQRTPGA